MAKNPNLSEAMKPKSQSKTKRPRKQKQSIEEENGDITPREFSLAVTKVAVSQICQSVGFKAFQRSALETLTNIATKYIEELAKWATSYSHASNRTESNLADVINAVEDMSLIQGFVGASALGSNNNCLLESSVLKELSCFVKYTDEIPFATSIPRQINSSRKWSNNGEIIVGSKGLHIPPWLPDFPDERSYRATNSRNTSIKRLWEEDHDYSELGLVGENCGTGLQLHRFSADLAMERRKVKFKIEAKRIELQKCRGRKREPWRKET